MNATEADKVIIIANAIMNSEHLSGVQQIAMVDKLLKKINELAS